MYCLLAVRVGKDSVADNLFLVFIAVIVMSYVMFSCKPDRVYILMDPEIVWLPLGASEHPAVLV